MDLHFQFRSVNFTVILKRQINFEQFKFKQWYQETEKVKW